MIAQAVSAYLAFQLLLTMGLIVAFVIRGIGRFRDQLRANYTLTGLTVAAFALHFFIPAGELFHPAIRLWAAPSAAAFDSQVRTGALSFAPSAALPAGGFGWLDYGFLFITGIAIGAIAVALLLSVRDGIRLYRLGRCSFAWRRLGRVRIYVSEETAIPFSYRTLFHAYVVLPIGQVAQPRTLRLCLQHELQHHRQGDTFWIYILFACKSLSFWNPLVHAWMAWIGELQELSCDEALVDQKRADPQAYARCLVEVAQTALSSYPQPACATGLLFGSRRQLLSRRISAMFSEKKNPNRWLMPAVGVCAAVLLSATAYGAKGLIQDRRITIKQAQEWANAAQLNTDFPVVVNEDVVRILNRYLGTPEGRDSIRNGLLNMQNHRDGILAAIRTYGLPEELLAVPLIESRYKNLPDANQMGHGAGLWMFIKSTARIYGLIVNNSVDQRLDVAMETDAAMRYLGSNNLRFRDWQLALMAYNQGEAKIQQCIDDLGSRDAWHLLRNGCKGDKDYLAKFMAAVLILKNPTSVR